MEHLIVALSRSYGSGGRAVGKQLAAKLGIPCYDKSIIELASEKSGLSPDYIGRLEELTTSSFLFNLAAASMANRAAPPRYDVPVSYTAFSAQSDVIRELAKKSSCVMVGRCSEYILRDRPDCVKVFVYADRPARLKRIAEEYGVSEAAAESQLTRTDKARANYYRNFTGETWGSPANHDLCINTTLIGTDGAVELICAYLKQRGLLP